MRVCYVGEGEGEARLGAIGFAPSVWLSIPEARRLEGYLRAALAYGEVSLERDDYDGCGRMLDELVAILERFAATVG